MGRKPIGEKKLSNKEKHRLYRQRNNSEERKKVDRERKKAERQKIYDDPQLHKKYFEKKNKAQRKYRKRKANE